MKFKSKQTTTPKEVPAPKVITESQLQEHLKSLQQQLVDAQTKVVMVQGAIQAVTLQIEELNPNKDSEIANGVS